MPLNQLFDELWKIVADQVVFDVSRALEEWQWQWETSSTKLAIPRMNRFPWIPGNPAFV